MKKTYKQIGWGLWLTGEDKYIGHPDRDESLQIFYSLNNNFRGLGVDNFGIFEFEGDIKPMKINFTKLYRRDQSSNLVIKKKINYNGKRFDRKEHEPIGYKGVWKGENKSGLFTFMRGELHIKNCPSSRDLIEITMLELTKRKLEKLHGKFKNHLEEFPFSP
jgi:hypothetical protein